LVQTDIGVEGDITNVGQYPTDSPFQVYLFELVTIMWAYFSFCFSYIPVVRQVWHWAELWYSKC